METRTWDRQVVQGHARETRVDGAVVPPPFNGVFTMFSLGKQVTYELVVELVSIRLLLLLASDMRQVVKDVLGLFKHQIRRTPEGLMTHLYSLAVCTLVTLFHAIVFVSPSLIAVGAYPFLRDDVLRDLYPFVIPAGLRKVFELVGGM